MFMLNCYLLTLVTIHAWIGATVITTCLGPIFDWFGTPDAHFIISNVFHLQFVNDLVSQ
ncbi:predicted protein [Arabidopsis lyrata subsp. lyrata]|uniref:Predicted protein n=1 Tax=Arabidopsis lyrata subsp. lyrata TaxID=81972 RepID=D7LG28_ARALL|nr:predicted protein [Arabidopsis lyrata subsp. lyrata]